MLFEAEGMAWEREEGVKEERLEGEEKGVDEMNLKSFHLYKLESSKEPMENLEEESS